MFLTMIMIMIPIVHDNLDKFATKYVQLNCFKKSLFLIICFHPEKSNTQCMELEPMIFTLKNRDIEGRY